VFQKKPLPETQQAIYSGVLLDYWQKGEPIYEEEHYLLRQLPADKNSQIIEAGCGGGRMLFHLESLGYQQLEGFDYVEEMIAFAKKTAIEQASLVGFSRQNLLDLSDYPAETYDACLCIQQLLSFLDPKDVPTALKEVHRILKPGGKILGVTLHYGGLFYTPFIAGILRVCRFFQKSALPMQSIPWLMMKGRPNWHFWDARQAQNYWFRPEELNIILINAGFEILLLESGNQISKKMHLKSSKPGWLFFVAQRTSKP